MSFVALCSDTDCDGTTFFAKRFKTEREARKDEYCYEVQSEPEFLNSELFKNLEAFSRIHFLIHGYASLGARWNPWVYDDTIGIPALDYTYDEPLYNDADIEQAQWEAE